MARRKKVGKRIATLKCLNRDAETVMEYVQAHHLDERKIKLLVKEGWTPTDNLSGTHHSEYIMFSRVVRSYSSPLPGQHKGVVVDFDRNDDK